MTYRTISHHRDPATEYLFVDESGEDMTPNLHVFDEYIVTQMRMRPLMLTKTGGGGIEVEKFLIEYTIMRET